MKNENSIICEGAFLYSTFTGKLTVTEGVMYENGCFQSGKKKIGCAKEPGVIYNSLLWLPERDDQKAEYLLVRYHEEAIHRLKEKIESHLRKIAIIRGGVINE